jgi:hypothetical protein
VRVQAFADPEAAVAEVRGEGRVKATGRAYRQEYVVFLRASAGKIALLREYFDPTRAARAVNTPILDPRRVSRSRCGWRYRERRCLTCAAAPRAEAVTAGSSGTAP